MNTYRMPFSVAITLLASSLSVHALAGGIEAGSPATRAKISAPAVRVLAQTSALERKAPHVAPAIGLAGPHVANLSPSVPSQQRATSSAATALADPGANSPAAGNAHGSNIGTANRVNPRVSPAGVMAAPHKILYAPADADDPAYRAAIAALTGGVVDYFDARAATPTAVQLAAYECVYTYGDYPFSNRVLFGDRLADFVDAGGKAILGVFCTWGGGGGLLGGRIMTAPYCPVTSPTGANHYAVSAYAGDGTTSLHAGVLAYDCMFRDLLVTQGAGVVDGHYADGEIGLAYRPDGRVVYTNGGGGATLGGTGDWTQIISNACEGLPTRHAILYAPSYVDDPTYRASIAAFTGGPVNYFNATAGTPSPALLATYDCVYTWVASGYSDRVTFGNNLADFVDAGGKVVLGVFCTFTTVASLGGRIMTSGYSPVTSPPGTNHYSSSTYAGDGTTCLHSGVAAYDCSYRDVLIAQGPGTVDGHYADGEIAQAYRPDGRVVYSNGLGSPGSGGGDWPRLIANACECNLATGHRILYAPGDPDDPAYRAVIATMTGGVVDYFDARSATPTLALMLTYDCVYTFSDYPYFDRALFGDRLADYADAGHRVIMGVACTYAVPYGLGGRIRTPAYSPVTSLLGNNHFTLSAYIGDGTTCFHNGVLAYDSPYRDFLVTQGAGKVDGHYADAEISFAYRPDRRVIYANGGANATFGGTGDWPRLIANACDCGNLTGNALACTNTGVAYGVNTQTGAGTFAYNLPTFGSGAGSTEIEIDPVTSKAWLQARDGFFFDQQFLLGSGAAAGPTVPNGVSYNGLEFALGRLYGTDITTNCGTSELRALDPVTGVGLPIGATSLGPIVGLAFDKRASALYGITSGCSSPSNLIRLDVTTGVAAVLGSTGIRAGSLEFGPGDDLFAGGDATDGGNLYSINRLTGATKLIGPSGFGSMTGLTFAPLGTLAVGDQPRTQLSLAALPNPSRGDRVLISFVMPVSGDAELSLFDIAGRRVWRQTMNALPPGDHEVAWNGRNSSGQRVQPGVYLVKFACPTGVRTVTQVMLR